MAYLVPQRQQEVVKEESDHRHIVILVMIPQPEPQKARKSVLDAHLH